MWNCLDEVFDNLKVNQCDGVGKDGGEFLPFRIDSRGRFR
jgi:hypothetical protein